MSVLYNDQLLRTFLKQGLSFRQSRCYSQQKPKWYSKTLSSDTQYQSPSMVSLLSGTQYVGKKTMTSE